MASSAAAPGSSASWSWSPSTPAASTTQSISPAVPLAAPVPWGSASQAALTASAWPPMSLASHAVTATSAPAARSRSATGSMASGRRPASTMPRHPPGTSRSAIAAPMSDEPPNTTSDWTPPRAFCTADLLDRTLVRRALSSPLPAGSGWVHVLGRHLPPEYLETRDKASRRPRARGWPPEGARALPCSLRTGGSEEQRPGWGRVAATVAGWRIDFMAQIAVIGAGYVGLTTAACFSHLGHDVVCADIDEQRVAQLTRGEVPIVEAGLDAMVREGLAGGRLSFVVGAASAAASAEFAYLCVPTPQGDDGSADLSYIQSAAVRVAALYIGVTAPIIVTDPASAETIKYASNAFLATKVSFVNAIAAVCEAVGADVKDVVLGMGYDKRIGHEFLKPGPGFGGSCFPKDSRALVHIADSAGYSFDLLQGVITVNEDQFQRVAAKVREMAGGSLVGVKVAVWGLTFKARTDDVRDSPALRIVSLLSEQGATVQAYDPAVKAPVDAVVPATDPYSVCEGADVLVVLTEWDDFRWLDFDKVADLMERPRVVDARNLLDKPALERRGFTYVGIGR